MTLIKVGVWLPILFAGLCWAAGPKDDFARGIQNFREQKFQEAEEAFKAALASGGNSSPVIFNLGLTELKLGKKGMALALWRKALFSDPNYWPARQARDMVASEIEAPAIAHEVSNWEWLRNTLLNPISLRSYLGLLALLMAFTGWTLIRYFGRRSRALEEEKPLPTPPVIGFVLAFCFLTVLLLTAAKVYDYFSPRGTIIVPKAEVKTGPGKESTTLFEIPEGNEVILKDSTDSWVQITYPGGMTGWVAKDSVLSSSGTQTW